jgi:Putative zinc-finger
VMGCQQIQEDMVARLDGELDAVARDAVDAHVRECPACAAELAAVEGVRAALERALAERRIEAGPSERRVQSLMAALGATEPQAGARRSARSPGGRQRRASRWRRPDERPADSRRPASLGRSSRSRAIVAIGGVAAAAVVLLLASGLGGGPKAPNGGGSSLAGLPSSLGRPVASDKPAPVDPEANRDRMVAGSTGSGPESGARVLAAAPLGDERDAADLQVPEELRRHPGLYLDFPIVQRLEKLRNLEAVYRQTDAGSG